MEQNKLRNLYIFLISNNHSFIPQILKVVSPLGKKIIFSSKETLRDSGFPSIFVLQILAMIPIGELLLVNANDVFLDYGHHDFSRCIYEVL